MDRNQLADLIADAVRDALAPMADRVSRLEGRVQQSSAAEGMALGELTQLHQNTAGILERLAVVETRQLQPGPPGKDGRDGFSLKDFGVSLLGDGRTLAFAFTDTDRDSTVHVKAPWPVDRGPWREGQAYEIGDVVSYDGSAWTCRESTGARPGDGATGWRLMVKRPRDGRVRS